MVWSLYFRSDPLTKNFVMSKYPKQAWGELHCTKIRKALNCTLNLWIYYYVNGKIKHFEKQHEVTKDSSICSNCSFKYTCKKSIQYGFNLFVEPSTFFRKSETWQSYIPSSASASAAVPTNISSVVKVFNNFNNFLKLSLISTKLWQKLVYDHKIVSRNKFYK